MSRKEKLRRIVKLIRGMTSAILAWLGILFFLGMIGNIEVGKATVRSSLIAFGCSVGCFVLSDYLSRR